MALYSFDLISTVILDTLAGSQHLNSNQVSGRLSLHKLWLLKLTNLPKLFWKESKHAVCLGCYLVNVLIPLAWDHLRTLNLGTPHDQP